MGKELKEVPCNICQSSKTTLFLKVNRFNLLRCCNCGLVYLNPRPPEEAIKRFYLKDYLREGMEIRGKSVEYTEYLKNEDLRFSLAIKRLKRMEKFKIPGRLLDVGCATGIFLKAARERGWETWGVEINPVMAEYGRKKYGINIYCGELHQANFPQRFFDVVTCWHVLEHLPHPRETLEEINRVLKSGGLLAIETPNLESPWAKWKGASWTYFTPPEHLYYFSTSTLCRLVRETGFKVREVRCKKENLPWFFPYGKRKTLLQLKHLFKKILDSSLEMMGQGDFIEMIAEKV